jgi:hypothetical protein
MFPVVLKKCPIYINDSTYSKPPFCLVEAAFPHPKNTRHRDTTVTPP